MAAFTAAEIDAMKGAQLRSESTAFGEDKTKQGARNSKRNSQGARNSKRNSVHGL